MAKACWEELGTWNLVLPLTHAADGFIQWLFQILQKTDLITLEKIAMVLWGIWRVRNDKLWNKTVVSAASVVSSTVQFLADWRAVRSIERINDRTNQQNGESVTWQKSQSPLLKCNIDASLQNESKNIGVGMVLRNSDGLFIAAKTNVFPRLARIKEAERMAFTEALSWVRGIDLQEVIFESDSKVVIEAVTSERKYDSEFGVIISACREILHQRLSFRVCFIRRQANKVAHKLAMVSCFHAYPMIWNSPPDFIYDVLNEDCNSLGY